VFSALVLTLGALPCEVEAAATCDMTMVPMPQPVGDDGAASKQVGCAIGCHLTPPVAAALAPPKMVLYSVRYADMRQSGQGIAPDPAVPPPRRLV